MGYFCGVLKKEKKPFKVTWFRWEQTEMKTDLKVESEFLLFAETGLEWYYV